MKMKKLLIAMTVLCMTGVLLAGCGASQPAGSAVQHPTEISATESKKTSKTDGLIEVDKKNLPEGIKAEDLTEIDGKYYISKETLKELAKASGKEIQIESKDGKTYTADKSGTSVTNQITANAKEEQTTAKQSETKPQSQGTASSGGTSHNSGNSGNASGNSNSGGSSSSGNASGGSNNAPTPQPQTQPQTQPVHQHTWVAATHTEDQGWYENIVEYHTVCNGCGMYLEGLSPDAVDTHLLTCNPGSYRGAYVTVGQQWISNPVTVTDYYYCSGCGARQ